MWFVNRIRGTIGLIYSFAKQASLFDVNSPVHIDWFDNSAVVDHTSNSSHQVGTSRKAEHPDFTAWIRIIFDNEFVSLNALRGNVLRCDTIEDVTIQRK